MRKIRNACGTPGPVRRDFNPGGKMCTAGVKETHACEFASFPAARFPWSLGKVKKMQYAR